MIIYKNHNCYSQPIFQKQHVLQFGELGFKTTKSVRLLDTQLGTLLWILKRNLRLIHSKAPTKIWNLSTPNLTLTKLSLESRMGKGKGPFFKKAVLLKPNSIIFEFSNLSVKQALYLLKILNKNFPTKLKLCKNFTQN